MKGLNPSEKYIQEIWNNKKSSIFMETTYGGDKSKTVPCGFNTEYKVKKKSRKRNYDRDLECIVRKLGRASVDNVEIKAPINSIKT